MDEKKRVIIPPPMVMQRPVLPPLPPRQEQSPEPGRCCQNGFFGQPHNCAKQPGTPPPVSATFPPPGVPPILVTRGENRTEEVLDSDKILDATLKKKHRNDPNVILFITNYMRCRVVAQAARESGLTPSQGSNLINRGDIYSAIVKLTEASSRKFGIDADEVVERMKEVLDVDPANYFNEDGSYKDLHQIEPAARRAIKSITIKETWGEDLNGIKKQDGRIVKLEFWSKEKAAEMLGPETEAGVFDKKLTVVNDVTERMETILLGGKERAEARRRELAAAKVIDVTPVKSDE